jgi:hypothetical protein
MEGVVVALELLVVVEKERERVVETYRREMAAFRVGMQAKNARKKLRQPRGSLSDPVRIAD